MADEFLEEKGEADEFEESADTSESGDTGETKTEDEKVEEPPTFSVAETFNNTLYESTDVALDIILRGPMPLARAKVVFKEEKIGDNIYGDSSVTPQGENPSADIILSGHVVLNFPEDGSVAPMDFMVPCGMESTTDVPSVWVSCAGEGNTDDIKSWYVFIITMQDTIPRYDDTYFRTIAVVLDSDNSQENNFVPLPQYGCFDNSKDRHR